MKKLLALLPALVLILSLCACGNEETPTEPVDPTEPVALAIAGSGTTADPWQIGDGDPASVTAYIDGAMMIVEGMGDVMDFENPEDRPWDTAVADLDDLSIFGEIGRVGKNAFRNAGKNSDFFGCYLGEVKEYGESCFEGANLGSSFILCVYDYVTAIESRAFADTGLTEMQFYSKNAVLADDAFAGLEAKFYTMARDNWSDDEKKDFGGKMTYKNMYRFAYTDIYDTEDVSGSGEMFVPEDWTVDFDAAINDDSEFIRYELVSGELEFDETDPFIGAYLTSDVELNIYYHYIG